MFKTILKRAIPRSVKNFLVGQVRDNERKARQEKESGIRRVRLSEKHMQNCELVLDRVALLDRLEKGGRIAEIGVNEGEFSEMILETTQPAILHLVDTWGSDRYHSGLYENVKGKFQDLISEGRIQIHRKLSLEAAEDFEDEYFSWIYIDTDHSYETTRQELLKYFPKVKRDGIIAGHDYSKGNWVDSVRYGVIEAVHEFCVEQDWELVYLTIEPIESQSFAIRRIRGNEKGA